MILIKILIIVIVLLMLAIPFLPIHWPFSFCYYRRTEREGKRNLLNIFIVLTAAVLGIVLLPSIRNFAVWLGALKPIAWMLRKIPIYAQYATELAIAIFVNVFFCLFTMDCLSLFKLGANSFKRIRFFYRQKNAKISKTAKQLNPKQKGKKDSPVPQGIAEPMPSELLPAPEKLPSDCKIVLPGVSEQKTKDTKDKTRKRGAQTDASQPMLQKRSALCSLIYRLKAIIYENVEDEWYVRPQMRHVAQHLRNFLIIVGILYLVSFALLLIPVLFPVPFLEELFYKLMQILIRANYLYPAIALALLTEIFWFFNGKAAPIRSTQMSSTQTELQLGRVVDLDALDADLMETVGRSYDVSSFYSNDIVVTNYDQTVIDLSQSPILQAVADYVRSQKLELNQEYLLGIKYFQEGRDVLFHAPLYTAVGTYLYAALNLRITQGERLVVICHNQSEIPSIIDSMQNGFLRVTRTHKPLWRIVSSENFGVDADGDVLVLTPEDFRNKDLFTMGKDFFRQVTVALLPDANLVVSSNNYYCQIISQRLAQCCKEDLQYIFLSTRNIKNLGSALTEYFLLKQAPASVRGAYAYGDTHIYIWRAKQDSFVMIDNAGQTMLPEVEICNIANLHGVPNPTVISNGAIYSNQVNTDWLQLYDTTDRPLGFAVVSDECYNLPSVIYAYSRYLGKKASVIHIMTRQYLLSNFFCAHATRYLFEQPLMECCMVEHAKQGKTGMIRLLCRLMEGIPVDDFILEMRRLGIVSEHDSEDICALNNFHTISTLVDECLKLALGRAPDCSQEHFTLYRPKEDFYPRLHIRINEDYDVLSCLLEETAMVQLRFRSGTRKPVYLNLFRRMLDQRYLIGQNLVYAHQNYEIKTIDRVRGIIDVDDATSVHGLARDYVQLRSYQIESNGFQSNCRENGKEKKASDAGVLIMREEFAGEENLTRALCMVRSETACRVSSDTLGYYMIRTDGESLRVTDSNIPIIHLGMEAQAALHREVTGCLYLRLELRRSRDDRLTMTFAALLQEMLKTLFPDCYFCLSVCPILQDQDMIYNASDSKSRTIAQLYPKLENWGDVCENSIELLLVDDCTGGTGALDLLFAPEGTFIQNVLWMLGDYLEWQRENENSPYIFFGMDTQPTIFDLDGIRPILQVFTTKHEREAELRSQLKTINRCTFCGEPMDQSYLWHNKYEICQCCSGEYTPDESEANRILRYTAGYLMEQFSIALPQFTAQVLTELHTDVLSELNVDQKTIRLIRNLPLTAMHVQILLQLVRYWQLEHLCITGAPEVQGQCNYVLLQYLRYLKQYQYARHLHRDYLLGKDEASVGYCILLQLLQADRNDNSFQYLLKHHCKDGKTPFRPVLKKRSSRTLNRDAMLCYHRSRLSGEEAGAYDAILDTYLKQAQNTELSAFGFSVEQVEMVHRYVLRDHPEIFWSNGKYSYTTMKNVVTVLTPQYTMSQEEREKRQKQIDEALIPFMSEISDEMGDYEVALKLYETVIDLLDDDTIALEKQRRTPSYDYYPDDLRSLYGAVVKHSAVCAGYAKAYQYLLLRCGIEALYVCGNCNKGGYHAWNIVKLEGDYYHVDVTWGDFSDTEPNKSRPDISFAYFAVTDEQIRRSRTIEVEPPQPRCISYSCNFFVRQHRFFTSYHAAEIREILTEHFKDPVTSSVELCFSNPKLLHDAEYNLCRNGGIYEALHAAGRDACTVSTLLREDICLLKLTVESE